MATSPSTRLGNTTIRHRRAVEPLEFPDSEPDELRVPEGKEHVLLKTSLFDILRGTYAREHTFGCDQYVYFHARDPGRKCAPDVFVKLGMRDFIFRSWKTWLYGAPDLAVEIDSPFDGKRYAWEDRFMRLWEAGVRELVRFQPEAPEGHRVRAFDRIDDDFVERVVEGDVTPCLTLGLWFVVRPIGELPIALRVARDADGKDLLLSPLETAERARQEAESAREAAERRVAELEKQLQERR
jgi:hypothetical protein